MKKIILIAGPSGAGKTSISHYLNKKYHIPRVVTHTTRPMRPAEVDQQSYYFETAASFAQLHLFERVKYGNYQYGSSREALEKAWHKSDIVSLIVDVQGARSYLEQLGKQAYFLYVKTSSLEQLRERLLERGDSPKIVNERLRAQNMNRLTVDLAPQAHILINDSWNKTQQALDQLIKTLK